MHLEKKEGLLIIEGTMTKKALASKLKYFCWILLFILCSLLIGIFVFWRS